MSDLSNVIPISVVAAIGIFLIKEILETVRRWKSDRQKRRSYRKLLARECELNVWVHKQLVRACEDIKANFDDSAEVAYSIDQRTPSSVSLRTERQVGGWSEAGLPIVRLETAEKILMEVAVNDKSLFAKLENLYDELINMRHLRESLIGYIETKDPIHKHFFEGFSEYALAELPQVRQALTEMYKECTGLTELQHRVR